MTYEISKTPKKLAPTIFCEREGCSMYQQCDKNGSPIYTTCTYFFDLLEEDFRPDKEKIYDYIKGDMQNTIIHQKELFPEIKSEISPEDISKGVESISSYIDTIYKSANRVFREQLFDFLRQHPECFPESKFSEYFNDGYNLRTISLSALSNIVVEFHKVEDYPSFLETHIGSIVDKNAQHLHENCGLFKKLWLGEKLLSEESEDLNKSLKMIGTDTEKILNFRNKLIEKRIR